MEGNPVNARRLPGAAPTGMSSRRIYFPLEMAAGSSFGPDRWGSLLLGPTCLTLPHRMG